MNISINIHEYKDEYFEPILLFVIAFIKDNKVTLGSFQMIYVYNRD